MGKRELGYKEILKFAKFRGLKISDSFRKNLDNSFSGCNQSKTTTSNIKLFFKKLINIELFEKIMDDIDLPKIMDLSIPTLRLKHLKSGYDIFFKSAEMEKSFLFYELNKTFNDLKQMISLKESGVSESSIELKISQGELFSRVNFDDSLFLAIENKVESFNFDLLLYYFACLGVEDKVVDKTPFQLFLEYLLIDLVSEETIKIKSPFEYYTLVVKNFYKNDNKKITNQKISKVLGMTDREFYHHKSGKRNLQPKAIKIIIKNGHFFYFKIIFIVDLVTPFLKHAIGRTLIIDKIKSYPDFITKAKVELKTFENRGQKK
jgi:hypothetical protein